MPQIFVDMDGVLADFDRHYHETFGVEVSKQKDNVDWSLVRGRPGFYADIPPMPDMEELWSFIQPSPIVLTGVPVSIPEAYDNKLDAIYKGRTRGAVGERNIKAKLTEGNVKEIRESALTTGALRLQFGVSNSTIQRIRSGKMWRHLLC